MLKYITRRRFGLAMGMLIASTAIGTSAKAQEDFYAGKQVTVIVGYGTGGGYDLYARLIARYLPRYIPGNPEVIVQNMPGAGSLKAANYIYSVAPKDGTTIAIFSPGLAMQAILGSNRSIEFDPLKMTWIGSSSSFTGDAYLLFSRVDGDHNSTADVLDKNKPPLILGGSGPGSNSFDVPVILGDTIGLNYKMVAGYPGSNEMNLAMERNETEARMVNLTGVKSVRPGWLKPDSGYKALVQFGRATRAEDLPDVPTARELAVNESALSLIKLAEIPFQLARPFAAPPGIPADRAATLQAAFLEAHADPELLAEAEKLGLDISPIGPEVMLESFASIENADPKNLDYLRTLYSKK